MKNLSRKIALVLVFAMMFSTASINIWAEEIPNSETKTEETGAVCVSSQECEADSHMESCYWYDVDYTIPCDKTENCELFKKHLGECTQPVVYEEVIDEKTEKQIDDEQSSNVIGSAEELKTAVSNGGKYVLGADIIINEILSVEKDLEIDGLNTYSITGTQKKTFEIRANVSFKNVKIYNTASSGRCIDTRTDGIEVSLENTILEATKGISQPLTIGGSDKNGLTINIESSTITAKGGYAIIAFVPAEITINESDISGYASIYTKEGSNGISFNITASNLSSYLKSNEPSNSFGTIILDDNTAIFMSGGTLKTVSEGETPMVLIGTWVEATEAESYVNLNDVNLVCEGNSDILSESFEEQSVLIAEGKTIDNFSFKIENKYYTSLEKALSSASEGQTIEFLKDTVLDEKLNIDKDIIFNLNGKTLTLPVIEDNYAIILNKNLTIKGNGTVNINGIYGFGIPTSSEATLTIENGNFIGAGKEYTAVRTDYMIGAFNGKVVINDGIFTNTYSVVNNFANANIEINGGLFDNTLDEYYALTGVNIVVKGGKFTGDFNPEYTIGNSEYYNAVAEGYYVEDSEIKKVDFNNVCSETELKAAIALNPEKIIIGKDIELLNGLKIENNLILDLNGKTISASENQPDTALIKVINAKLVITGNGKINSASQGNDYGIAIWAAKDAEVIIENGEFTNKGSKSLENDGKTPNNNELIYASATGKIVINGGKFFGNTENAKYSTKYTLNCQDNSQSTITCNGGQYFGFNPLLANVGKNEIIVPTNKTIIDKIENNNTWYYVEDVLNLNTSVGEAFDNIKENDKIILDEAAEKALEKNPDATISAEIVVAALPEELVSEDIKEDMTSEGEIVKFIDISVYVTVDGEYAGTIKELSEKIKIYIDLPADAEDENVKYIVLREHNDEINALEIKKDNDGYYFETDKFSTYALVKQTIDAGEEEPSIPEPTPTPAPTTKPSSNKPSKPKEYNWTPVNNKINSLKVGEKATFDMEYEFVVPSVVWQQFYGEDVDVTFECRGENYNFNGVYLKNVGFNPNEHHDLRDLREYIGKIYPEYTNVVENTETKPVIKEEVKEEAVEEEITVEQTPTPTVTPEPTPESTPVVEIQKPENNSKNFPILPIAIGGLALFIIVGIIIFVKSRDNE